MESYLGKVYDSRGYWVVPGMEVKAHEKVVMASRTAGPLSPKSTGILFFYSKAGVLQKILFEFLFYKNSIGARPDLNLRL